MPLVYARLTKDGISDGINEGIAEGSQLGIVDGICL